MPGVEAAGEEALWVRRPRPSESFLWHRKEGLLYEDLVKLEQLAQQLETQGHASLAQQLRKLQVPCKPCRARLCFEEELKEFFRLAGAEAACGGL